MSQEYELEDVTIEQTSNLMAQIKQHVQKLRDLHWKMIEAEEALKQATDEYNEYSRKVLPDMFKMNGLDALQMDDGAMVRVVTSTTCSINKNDKDRANVADWLRQHNGESLIKSECICPSSQLEALKAANIIYEEKTTMNTNSVKAFLLDQLGQKGSPATITKDDLPKGLNFYQFDEMEITMRD